MFLNILAQIKRIYSTYTFCWTLTYEYLSLYSFLYLILNLVVLLLKGEDVSLSHQLFSNMERRKQVYNDIALEFLSNILQTCYETISKFDSLVYKEENTDRIISLLFRKEVFEYSGLFKVNIIN